MKIQPWTLGCPLWCPCGPMDHQHGDPKAKIKPPRYQNDLKVSRIIVSDQTDHPCQQSTCQQLPVQRGAGGRAEALIYIYGPGNLSLFFRTSRKKQTVCNEQADGAL